jgi:uncharacterized protein involved in exopolysaccharide biosynthesis
MPETLEPIGGAAGESSLPLDPIGIFLRLRARWTLLVLGLAASLAIASVVSLRLGTRIYSAETLLLYRPVKGNSESLNLQTQLSLIKTQANLAETRKRLGLKSNLESLGRDYEVKLQRNSDLLALQARDSDPKLAAAKAQTLRDVFLEQQDTARKTKLKNTLADQERRLQKVENDLKRSELELETFTLKNRIIDLDKQAQWYLEQLTNLQVLYEQAKVERSSVKLQAGNIDRIISDLKARIEKEKQENANMANLGDLNIQAQRLRDALHDDRQQRSGNALLRQKQLEYERALRLRERGLISQAELDKDQAAYESQKALTVDTPQTKEWKTQIDAINAMAVPKGNTVTTSGTVLQQVTLKSFDLQLSLVTQDQKVRRLEEAIRRAQARLDQIPKLQQTFQALTREVTTRAAEKSNLEGLLGETRRAFESKGNDFTIASEASIPLMPAETTRRKFFVLVFLLLEGVSTLGILLLCLLDDRLLTPKELSLALGGAPVGQTFASPKPLDAAFLARQLRRYLPGGAASLAIVSPVSGAGKSQLLKELSKAWGEQGERLAIVDLQSSGQNGQLPQLPPGWSGTPWQPSGNGPIALAQLSADQLKPWLHGMLEHFSLVLLEAPAAETGVAADLLAASCDQVLVVARARSTQKRSISHLKERLGKEGEAPIQGVLTDTPDWFRFRTRP